MAGPGRDPGRRAAPEAVTADYPARWCRNRRMSPRMTRIYANGKRKSGGFATAEIRHLQMCPSLIRVNSRDSRAEKSSQNAMNLRHNSADQISEIRVILESIRG